MSGRPKMQFRAKWLTARKGLLLLMLAAALLGPASVRAQVLYGSLTGTVTDTSGAVIAGAQVSALETSTGVQRSQISDSIGIYRFRRSCLAPTKSRSRPKASRTRKPAALLSVEMKSPASTASSKSAPRPKA